MYGKQIKKKNTKLFFQFYLIINSLLKYVFNGVLNSLDYAYIIRVRFNDMMSRDEGMWNEAVAV
jgi:hypothetical protein